MKPILSLTLVLFVATSAMADGVISDAMKKYHKGDTAPCKKVGAGEASPSELADFLKAYEDMAATKPKKGDAASWDEKTKAVIEAVKGLQKGDESAKEKFKTAINCKACHQVHKGK